MRTPTAEAFSVLHGAAAAALRGDTDAVTMLLETAHEEIDAGTLMFAGFVTVAAQVRALVDWRATNVLSEQLALALPDADALLGGPELLTLVALHDAGQPFSALAEATVVLYGIPTLLHTVVRLVASVVAKNPAEDPAELLRQLCLRLADLERPAG